MKKSCQLLPAFTALIFVGSLCAQVPPTSMRLDSSFQRVRQAAIVSFYYQIEAKAFDYNPIDSIGQLRSYSYAIEYPGSPLYWENYERQFYTYGAQQKIILKEKSYDLMDWSLSARFTTTLDILNKPVELLNEYWNGNYWDISSRYLYKHDPAGRLSERLLQLQNYQILGWNDRELFLIQYDTQGREVFNQTSTWLYDSLIWEIQSEKIFRYDSLNRKIEQIDSKRSSNLLRPLWKSNWSYNSNNQLDTFRFYTTFGSGIWRKNRQTISFFDPAGGMTTQYNYKNYLDEWMLNSKRFWLPNPVSAGVIDSTNLFVWNYNLMDFVIKDRETYVFWELPGNTFYYSYLLEEFFDGEWIEARLEENWYSDSSSTKATEPERLEWSCQFPNPYTPGQSIQCPNLPADNRYQARLFSLDGRDVFSTSFQGNEHWQINAALPAGMYNLLILKDNQALVTQKIVLANQ